MIEWETFIFHCTKCHHEWESAYKEVRNCDWCCAIGKLINERIDENDDALWQKFKRINS